MLQYTSLEQALVKLQQAILQPFASYDCMVWAPADATVGLLCTLQLLCFPPSRLQGPACCVQAFQPKVDLSSLWLLAMASDSKEAEETKGLCPRSQQG